MQHGHTIVDCGVGGFDRFHLLVLRCSDGFKLQCLFVIPVSLFDSDEQANQFAFTCLQKGFIPFGQLAELCAMLPNDKPRKHILEHSFQEPRCFATGAYVFGGEAVIRNSVKDFPWVARLLCSIVRATAEARPRFAHDESMVRRTCGCTQQPNFQQHFDSCRLLGWWGALGGKCERCHGFCRHTAAW